MRRLLVLVTTLLLVHTAAALASGGAAVIRDCTDDGKLEGHYTQKQLRQALASIPSDVDEYTNCRSVIRHAAFSGGGGGGGGGAGGDFGGFKAPEGDPLASASDAERADVAKAIKQGGGAVRLADGSIVRPSQIGRRTGAGSTEVPTPLLIAAILLALGALATAAPTLRARVLPRSGT